MSAVINAILGAGGAPLDGANTWTGVNTFDAQVQWSKGADVASATALPILTDGNTYTVTGTTDIETINTTGHVGTIIYAKFAGILDLVNSASLVLITGANITTAAGDWTIWCESASGVFDMIAYTRADGTALVSAGGGVDGIVSTATGTVLTLSDALSAFTNKVSVVSSATTADAMTVTADALTSGNGFVISTNSADGGAFDLLKVIVDNASAFQGIAVNIQQDGTGKGILLNQNGNGIAFDLNSAATSATALDVVASALTSGKLARFNSNSADATARDLFEIVNDNTAAVGATVLKVRQDSTAPASEFAKGTTDGGFFNFTATADADTTSAISTLNTSGATTDHIQIELNGTKAWIAVSTNNPS